MVIRTILEDRMLQAELPGFRDYVQQVRSPPLPGVWCGALWFFPDKE
jgi:protein-S-isoprenylcysteine O-methyltransferase Ste14